MDGIENEYVRDTKTGEYRQISNIGGNDFDIIHDGTFNDDGSITYGGNTRVDNVIGFDDPQRGDYFFPASGQLQTLDGADDPIFSALSLGLGSQIKTADAGFDVLGFAAGRSGKQARMREIMNDSKVSRTIRGWFKNELRHIRTGNRKTLRNPFNGRKSPGRKRQHKGLELAHPNNAPASSGRSYSGAKYKNYKEHKTETRIHNKRYRKPR